MLRDTGRRPAGAADRPIARLTIGVGLLIIMWFLAYEVGLRFLALLLSAAIAFISVTMLVLLWRQRGRGR